MNHYEDDRSNKTRNAYPTPTREPHERGEIKAPNPEGDRDHFWVSNIFDVAWQWGVGLGALFLLMMPVQKWTDSNGWPTWWLALVAGFLIFVLYEIIRITRKKS